MDGYYSKIIYTAFLEVQSYNLEQKKLENFLQFFPFHKKEPLDLQITTKKWKWKKINCFSIFFQSKLLSLKTVKNAM